MFDKLKRMRIKSEVTLFGETRLGKYINEMLASLDNKEHSLISYV